MTPEILAKSGSEDSHQSALFCYFQINRARYPETQWMFAIPNGGWRDKRTAGKLKGTGVKAGVPDICLPIRRGQFSGLWIEFKAPAVLSSDGNRIVKPVGRATPEQKVWIDMLRCQGYVAEVCVGWEQARDVVISYLEQRKM